MFSIFEQSWQQFLNQACAGLWPTRAWFLEIVTVRTSLCVCVCAHASVCMRDCMHVYMCMCACACVCVRVRVGVCVCVCAPEAISNYSGMMWHNMDPM